MAFVAFLMALMQKSFRKLRNSNRAEENNKNTKVVVVVALILLSTIYQASCVEGTNPYLHSKYNGGEIP